MRQLLLVMLFISACAQWKQKDFEKELNKPAEEVKPVVVATAKEEKILEKFEVQPAEPTKATVETKPAQPIKAKIEFKKSSKTEPAKPVVKVVAPPEVKVAAPKALPADYPAELIAINDKSKKVWELYKPNHHINQKTYLDIHYLGMTVGKIMVVNQGKKMVNNKEVWHFHARFKSAPFYSNIYELDDTVDTYVQSDQFLSSRYSLIQRESKQNIDDLQLHDRDQFKTFWFYHQKKSDGSIKDKKQDSFIPFFSIDPFSMLFFYQGLPLKNGDYYEIPLINKAKILMLRSQVEGREEIDTEKGRRKAIRIHATTKYTGETLKSGDMYLWFSDDQYRTLLRAQAKIKIGSVTADIVEK